MEMGNEIGMDEGSEMGGSKISELIAQLRDVCDQLAQAVGEEEQQEPQGEEESMGQSPMGKKPLAIEEKKVIIGGGKPKYGVKPNNLLKSIGIG